MEAASTPAPADAATLKLWQLVALVAVAALVVGVAFGRYVVPQQGNVNKLGAEFERHLNQAFAARQASYQQQQATSASQTDLLDAETHLRAAVPALEAYNADHGSYIGATLPALQSYEPGVTSVDVVVGGGASYCIESTSGAAVAHKAGPVAEIESGPCPR